MPKQLNKRLATIIGLSNSPSASVTAFSRSNPIGNTNLSAISYYAIKHKSISLIFGLKSLNLRLKFIAMSELYILIILLVIVGFIFVSVVRSRSKNRATLTKTMSFNPETDVAVPQNASAIPQSTPSTEFRHSPCALATALRVVGIINIVASFIVAMFCGSEYGSLIAFIAILSGCLGGLCCYALAKCVDAADHYLNNH